MSHEVLNSWKKCFISERHCTGVLPGVSPWARYCKLFRLDLCSILCWRLLLQQECFFSSWSPRLSVPPLGPQSYACAPLWICHKWFFDLELLYGELRVWGEISFFHSRKAFYHLNKRQSLNQDLQLSPLPTSIIAY